MLALATLKYYVLIVQIVIRTFIDVYWKVKISKINRFKLKLWDLLENIKNIEIIIIFIFLYKTSKIKTSYIKIVFI